MYWEHFLEYFKNEKNFCLISVNQRERYYQEMVILSFKTYDLIGGIEFYRIILGLNEGREWSRERSVEVDIVVIGSCSCHIL